MFVSTNTAALQICRDIEPGISDLPKELRQALSDLGNEPTTRIVTVDLVLQLITRGLIEATHVGGVRFTESGKQLFHELRGTLRPRNS